MRARSALLSGLAVLVVLQVGLAVGIELWGAALRNPAYAARAARLKERLVACPESPLCVVVLGSSRAFRGVRAGDLEGSLTRALGRPVVVHNFAMDGAGPVTALLNWRRLRRDGIRPDLVLAEVLPLALAGQHPLPEVERLHPTRSLWWGDLDVVERYAARRRADVRREWEEAWPVPFYTHRLALLARLAPELLPPVVRAAYQREVDDTGCAPPWPGPVTPGQRRRFLRLCRRGYRPYLKGFRLGGPGCQALEELLGECGQEGVPAALVLMPEGPSFRALYPARAWPEVRAWVGSLSARQAAPLVDARAWLPEEEFLDSHHLLPGGAARFTRRLGREFLLPLLGRSGGALARRP